MLLTNRTFFVKERVAFAKLTDTYDILDPQSGAQLAIAKEEPPPWAKYLRLIVNKHLMPTTVNIYERDGDPPKISIKRGAAFFRPRVTVTVDGARELGTLQAKAFTIGGAFRVFDSQQNEIATLKGDWKGWNFQMLGPTGEEIGRVTKKWAGIGKELFTSADNYVIALSDSAPGGADAAALLLAAGIAVDTVYKEKQ